MKTIYITALLMLLTGCTEKNENTFDTFTYSHSEMMEDYSIKFTNSDTMYLWQRYPDSETYFKSQVPHDKIDSIKKIALKVFKDYDNESYFQSNLSDGEAMEFSVRRNDSIRWVWACGHIALKELYAFDNYLKTIKKNTNWIPIQNKIEFDTVHILPPPPIEIRQAPLIVHDLKFDKH